MSAGREHEQPLDALALGNILAGQWGNAGRYLKQFGVLRKEIPLVHFPPHEMSAVKCIPNVGRVDS